MTGPTERQVKEVFAKFGAAMYQAQVLEHSLTTLLVTVFGPGPSSWTKADFDAGLDGLSRLTLGALVQRVQQAGATTDLLARLTAVLKRRNWLAHHYFWERALDFTSTSGCTTMTDELDASIEDFVGVNSDVRALTLDWMTSHGMDVAAIEVELARLLAGEASLDDD